MFGQRQIVNIVEEEKQITKQTPDGGLITETKKWKYFELSGFEWLSWKESVDFVRTYGAGYRALELKKGDMLTIFAETSRDWMFTAMACMSQSITVTTAYATLGEEGLTFSLQECEVSSIFTNADLLPLILKVAGTVPTLKNIIYNGTPDSKILKNLKETHKHLTILSLAELHELGSKNPCEIVAPTKDDLALVMYTSGSTGPPKGVMITHGNIIASVAGSVNWFKDHATHDEVYLAYLPMAHILEFSAEMSHLYWGTAIGYGSVKTLTDSSVRNCKGDLRELRPTIFVGVPAVWESIRKGVTSKIEGSGFITKAIFNGAFSLKSILNDFGLGFLAAPLDIVVFSKIKDQVGGRLKIAGSGGAPIPKSTLHFLHMTTAMVVNGYGMTECTAFLAFQDLNDSNLLGVTGTPITSLEVKLVDVENTAYKASNLPKPQGEVWVRGPCVTKGYYRQDKLTREAITADGWLKTGDIAEINDDGSLTIIDRKKNLVKLSNGEYIALEKLESNYKVSKYVQNICVFADSEQSYAVALIQPIEKEIRATAALLSKNPNVDVEHLDYHDLCNRHDIRKAVLDSLKDIAKNVGFKHTEIIGQVFLDHEEWTPQNEMLTAAMKLQRTNIVKKLKNDIQKMYGA
ncbi:long-chain fatty acid-CoA ligase [Physocladia obscura]|uniref:Long-chain fatty acid-CoA ligase n=1 Tax=Physocladia obscura TaxID=109957 RepID=A0AAD5XBR7_9FUNG|nr:long-chain fatty acid-CoA ligase [Physocladia obscura]